eukprot:COSAG06_NODE_3502_length_5253_cov_2.040109_11_plen_99_part_00
MAPRVPKGNHRDPFVKTVLPRPENRSGEQPLLLSHADYRKALDGHDEPLSTCYLFFISFFFYAAGASIVLIQGVCVALPCSHHCPAFKQVLTVLCSPD